VSAGCAQVLQEEIARAARAVERSIEDGQPVAFAHHKPVTDLLNEVGAGDWSSLQGGGPGAGALACQPHECMHGMVSFE
jgi:hypothetical protein